MYLSADAATAIFVEKLKCMLEALEVNFIKFRHFKNRYNIMKEELFPSNQKRPISKNSLDDSQLPPIRNTLIKPYNERSMTNVSCLIPYCLLSFVVISAFFYSFILEKQRNIFKPEDPDGRKCGYAEAINFPYIYFPVPFAQTINQAVCIRKCPTSYEDKIECLPNSFVKNCSINISDHFNKSNQYIVYPTKVNNFLSMCQPDSRILFDTINSQINTYSLIMNLEEIYQSLKVILIACPLISIFLVAFYVLLMTKIPDMRYVFKGFILIFIISLLAFSLYSFTTSAKRIFIYMPIVGIVVFIIALGFIASLFYYRNFLQRSLVLINIGVEYIRQNRGLIFMSLFVFFIWVIVFALEAIALIFIYSIGSGNQLEENYQYHFPYFVGISNSIFVKILIGLTIVHYFWTNLILYHMGQYICMAAGTFWILDIKHNFKNSLFTLLRFHLGSVVLGSIMITLLGKITQFLYFIMPNVNGRLNCLCCCYCPTLATCYRRDCFKKYMGIYTDLSYIRVAMKGQDLITAGQQITAILVDNVIYIHRAYRLARIIVFITKILVALATTFICYIIIEFSSNMRGSFLTNIIIFVFSAFLTSFAFDSYDRSFEVILITILIQPNKIEFNNDLNAFPQREQLSKQKLYNKVLTWFQQEKSQETSQVNTRNNG